MRLFLRSDCRAAGIRRCSPRYGKRNVRWSAQASSQRDTQRQEQEEMQQSQEGTEQSKEGTKQQTQEGTEQPQGSTGQPEDSEEAGTGTEEKTPGAEKSPAEMTAAEKMQFLTIEGVPLPIPCKVGDLDDRFSLENGLAWKDYYTVRFFCQGKWIGNIYIEGLDMKNTSWKDGLIDMSSGYEDGTITGLNLSHGSYELPGISSSSTREELVALWGRLIGIKNQLQHTRIIV